MNFIVLFQQIYNWVKHKTLPPATLAKNRLFVERDSKRKRIFTNFGLSFRNSKWSSFVTNNVKFKFKLSGFQFLKYLLIAFAAIFITVNYDTYYICKYIFNTLYMPFWSCQDLLSYYFLFTLWAVLAFFSWLMGFIYQRALIAFFTALTANSEPLNLPAKSSSSAQIISDKKMTTRYELTQVMTSWLIKSNNRAFEELVGSSFSHKIDYNWWTKTYNMFPRLTKSMLTLNLDNSNQNKWKAISTVSSRRDGWLNTTYLQLMGANFFATFFQNTTVLNYHSPAPIDGEKNKLLLNFNNFNNQTCQTNLFNLTTKLNKYPFLVKNKTGLFFFHEFDYQKLNHLSASYLEFSNLTTFLQNQLSTAKWERWLYRYSILHRKVIKNAHKLTLTKRLLNVGIFNKKITNLYDTNLTAFNAFASLNFKTSSLISNTPYALSKLIDTSNCNLTTLSYYEYSYFWFLKRFYLFNTLPNNFIKSSVRLNNVPTVTFFKSTPQLKLNFFNTKLLKSLSLNLRNLSYIYRSNSTFESLVTGNSFVTSNSYAKDLYLFLSENELFSHEFALLASRITTPFTSGNKLYFYNYLNFLYSRNLLFFYSIPSVNCNTPKLNKKSIKFYRYSKSTANSRYLLNLYSSILSKSA